MEKRNGVDLIRLRQELEEEERQRLSSYATLSTSAVRATEEPLLLSGHRLYFSVDSDRILHSLAYARYIDKTQVFSLVPNDHITHRVLHVQMVSKISRTIARLLRLNEDLTEAIALGHDIGHPPFGHDGERILSRICVKYGLPPFQHSIQGVRFLREVERKGRGCNLTLQVLDGILCHDGETHMQSIKPQSGKTFEVLDRQILEKALDPAKDLTPMTLEGCVVRMADVISYVGRDIEDAIRLGLISRDHIPRICQEVLGTTNGTIVYTLVEDVIRASLGKNEISFSSRVADALALLKDFNMEFIYMNPKIKTEASKIEDLYGLLFDHFLDDLEKGHMDSIIFTEFLNGMDRGYMNSSTNVEIVRDFIAGMTDAYFLRTGQYLLIPQPLPSRFKSPTRPVA